MAREPRRPRDRAAPGRGRAPGRLGRLGRRMPAPRSSRSSSTGSACTLSRSATTTSSASTRDSRTRRSGRSTTTRSRRRSTAATGAMRTARSTSGSRTRRRTSAPRARRSGCTTTSSSSCRRCCAPGGRTCGSASSFTFRSRRSSCSCRCRCGRRSSAASSAPTSSASSRSSRRRTSSGSPATCSGCSTGARRSTSTGARSRPARSRSRSTRRGWRSSPTTEAVQARAREIRAELGDPKTLILGVDRLDYTKGIELRLEAFRELLEDGTLSAPETIMVQVATPSRERVEHYETLRTRVEREVGRINGEFGRVGMPAVHYLHQSYSRSELAALYCAADVMMVTPLRDGMNLVAKEYVAARIDHGGALVLSEFAGAANELRHAFLCNPHDADAVKDALMRAIRVGTVGGEAADADHAAVPARPRRRPLGPLVPRRPALDAPEASVGVSEHERRAAGSADGMLRRRAACGARPDRTGAAAPRRLRLRRHARAARRRPDHGRAAARGGRRGARAGRAAADHRRRHLGPSAARPGHAVAPAERGAPRRQPRLGVRPRLHPATRARAPRAARPAPRRADGDRRARIRASASRRSRRASRCTCVAPTASGEQRAGGRPLWARRPGRTSTSRTART